MRELRDGRGYLEALGENDLLALEANIFGPLDETGQVGLGLDVLTYRRSWISSSKTSSKTDHTNTEVLRRSLEERVLSRLGGLAGEGRSSGLLAFGGLGGLVIETRYISGCFSQI